MRSVKTVAELFASRGAMDYLGEAVSVATHMLQAGTLAQNAGVVDAVVAATLLHDVGHLVAERSDDADARHETTGAAWLTELGFPADVTEPVRLHVAAKRYLCAMEPAYFDGLSVASRRSLELQGGAMTMVEPEQFSRHKHAAAAVAVRRWDDLAKDPSVRQLDGTEITGFGGFDPSPSYTLGYLTALLQAGVPVVYGYIADAHDSRNSCTPTSASNPVVADTNNGKPCGAYAPGETDGGPGCSGVADAERARPGAVVWWFEPFAERRRERAC